MVLLSDINIGDWLQADDGFSCLDCDDLVQVKEYKTHRNEQCNLYVRCREGEHGLDGQLDTSGQYVIGFIKADWANDV